MSHLTFKYCPFCGGHMPLNTVIHYCPFCGEKFLLTDNQIPTSQFLEQLTVQEILPQEEIVSGNKDLIEINIDNYNYNKMHQGKFLEFNYYSIILKDALNKQSLVNKLEKELLRGSFAIRLAVDNIPNIIIYKAKSDEIVNLIKIFIEEEASISVIAGDFNDKPTVEQLFNDFDKLSLQAQQLVKKMPIGLWLGDRIHSTFPHTYLDNKEGIMIITDKNIYFVPNHISTVSDRWFVRSYNLLSTVIRRENHLELAFKGVNVTDIAFADKKTTIEAYQSILHVVQKSKQ